MAPLSAQEIAPVSVGVSPSENELCFVCVKVEEDEVGAVKMRKSRSFIIFSSYNILTLKYHELMQCTGCKAKFAHEGCLS